MVANWIKHTVQHICTYQPQVVQGMIWTHQITGALMPLSGLLLAYKLAFDNANATHTVTFFTWLALGMAVIGVVYCIYLLHLLYKTKK